MSCVGYVFELTLDVLLRIIPRRPEQPGFVFCVSWFYVLQVCKSSNLQVPGLIRADRRRECIILIDIDVKFAGPSAQGVSDHAHRFFD